MTAAGTTQLVVTDRDVLTDEAVELARKLGLRIRRSLRIRSPETASEK